MDIQDLDGVDLAPLLTCIQTRRAPHTVKLLRPSVLLTLAMMLPACLMTGVSQVDTDPEFDWNTIKRDQILMTPLVDLRPSAARGQPFFTDQERLGYPEKFKQTFFKLRKDLRVFGAGGAYEKMAGLPQFDELARRVFAKEALPADAVAAIKAGAQEIRFIFFFAITRESLDHSFQYVFRKDQKRDVKRYSSTRSFDVRLALWDVQTNKTVWIATEHLTPSNQATIEVENSSKRLVKDGKNYVWKGFAPPTSLASELAKNLTRFPSFPDREPEFSGSFDDFALALPIHPSEEKLIEYSYFTYHRPEAGVRVASLHDQIELGLALGYSSIIYNRYRVGGLMIIPFSNQRVQYAGDNYDVTALSYGLTWDREWTISNNFRLLTGVLLGGTAFSYELVPAEEPVVGVGEEQGESDGAFIVWPRAQFLFGERQGFQWGLGVAYRFFDGIEEPVLKANRPSIWGVDASIAWTMRGF